MEYNAEISGGDNFCCPNCKKKLKVKVTIHGDDPDDDNFDTITSDDVMERLWFEGIDLEEEQ